MELRVEVVTGSQAAALAGDVWPCYDAVFGDVADEATWRADLVGRHAAREGFRLAAARTDDGTVVGFAWGYVGRRGQYWADLVHEALPADVADVWVGGHFELVELAVLETHRRTGLGRTLHDRVLDGVDRRCLLGTSADDSDPAVRLYRSCGWQHLGLLPDGMQVMGCDRRTT